jgi:hypothetical protein
VAAHRGLGRLAAEPRSPAPKSGSKKAEYRGGIGPNTRPAGGAAGLGWQRRRIAAKFSRLDRGDRGSSAT